MDSRKRKADILFNDNSKVLKQFYNIYDNQDITQINYYKFIKDIENEIKKMLIKLEECKNSQEYYYNCENYDNQYDMLMKEINIQNDIYEMECLLIRANESLIQEQY
jgi:hypothetical protein